MKEKIYYFAALSLCVTIGFFSCTSKEVIDVLNEEIIPNDYISMGNLEISRVEGTPTYSVDFRDENGASMLNFSMIALDAPNLFGYDVESDGIIDFYVQFLNEDMSEFNYLNRKKEILQKCSFIKRRKNEFSISVLDCHDISKLVVTRSSSEEEEESWSECFNRRMGSNLGIIMMVVSGFVGPEGPAGVAAGAALSCLIYRKE